MYTPHLFPSLPVGRVRLQRPILLINPTRKVPIQSVITVMAHTNNAPNRLRIKVPREPWLPEETSVIHIFKEMVMYSDKVLVWDYLGLLKLAPKVPSSWQHFYVDGP
jgi:hypothetical protein